MLRNQLICVHLTRLSNDLSDFINMQKLIEKERNFGKSKKVNIRVVV